MQKTQISFTSKLYPIKPFEVLTDKGPILIKELSKNELNKSADFYIDSSIEFYGPTDNYWRDLSGFWKEMAISNSKKQFKKVLKGSEGNVLIGMDKNNDVKAVLTLKNLKNFRQGKVGLMENFVVDKELRGQGLGKIMMDKILKTTKPFSDLVMSANSTLTEFYSKFGFKQFNIEQISDDKYYKPILEILFKNYEIKITTPMLKILK